MFPGFGLVSFFFGGGEGALGYWMGWCEKKLWVGFESGVVDVDVNVRERRRRDRV